MVSLEVLNVNVGHVTTYQSVLVKHQSELVSESLNLFMSFCIRTVYFRDCRHLPKRHLNLIWSPLGHISRVSLIKKRHLIKISDIVLIFARWETVESADGGNSRWEMIIVAYYTSCVTLIFLYAYAAKFLFQKYKLYKKVGKWLWSIRYRDYCIIKHCAFERIFPT